MTDSVNKFRDYFTSMYCVWILSSVVDGFVHHKMHKLNIRICFRTELMLRSEDGKITDTSDAETLIIE